MKKIDKKYIKSSLFIFIISILVFVPMFNPNFNMQYDDGVQHICRLIGTEMSIKEGSIFPVIMSKLCNNFGYSWNLFYSPFTAYMPLIFRFFDASYTLCLKLFMLALSILAGYSMYFFVKKFVKGKVDDKLIENISILSGVLYILVPYRLNDMYIRLAVAELASFIFLPIVFNGLYTTINLKQKNYILILGSIGMLLTHSMLTVYLALFSVIYILFNIKILDKKIIFNLIKDSIIILLLTSFYWIPFLESKIATNYEVFNQEHMLRLDALIQLKPNILEIILPIKNRMMYGVGIVVILGIIFSVSVVKKQKDLLYFWICGLLTLLITIDIFPFEKLPSFFTMMQFSFRLLEFSSFFLIIVAVITLGIKLNTFNTYTVIFLTTISIIFLLPNLLDLKYGTYYTESQLINSIPVTSKTGRVHAGCASFEYLPTKAFENREYIENRKDIPIILNKNDVEIQKYEKKGIRCVFNILGQNTCEDLIIELPYIYYIGYNVKFIDENNNEKIIQTYESENGFVCITIPNIDGKVEVEYTGTYFMKLSYLLTILTGIIILCKILKNSLTYKK